jgi:CAAX protease family protein
MSSPARSNAGVPSPRVVAPRPALGLAAYLTYVVTIFVVGLVMGVDYDEIADSSGNIVKGVIVPIALGSVLMAVFATRLGWWRLVLRERPTGSRWLLIVPVLVLLGCVAGAADTPWGEWDADVLVLLAVGALFVGFGEEMATRGLLLVGMRGRFKEVWVWLVTSALFALMHGLNFVMGQDLGPTLAQVGFTFVIGSVLYATRRITGLLVVSMVLHFLWDFTLLASQGPGEGASRDAADAGGLQGPAMFLAVIVTLFAMQSLVRNRNREHSPPLTPAG